VPSSLRVKIKALLCEFSNKEWNVEVQQSDSITLLRDILIEEVKSSGDFLTIKNKFSNADISDILLAESV
jgi:hypothetical protein